MGKIMLKESQLIQVITETVKKFLREQEFGNVKIVRTSRVTAGMNPKIRFEFSDGKELQSSSDGYGVEREDEIYQNLIADWFSKH